MGLAARALRLTRSGSLANQLELEALAGYSWLDGCGGSRKVVELPRGIRCLLIEGPTATSVIWLEGTTRFDLSGPSDTFELLAAILVASVTIRTHA